MAVYEYLAEHTTVNLLSANVMESRKEGWSSVSGESQGPTPILRGPCRALSSATARNSIDMKECRILDSCYTPHRGPRGQADFERF